MGDGHGVSDKVLVGQDDPFGESKGTGGVDDGRRIVLVHIRSRVKESRLFPEGVDKRGGRVTGLFQEPAQGNHSPQWGVLQGEVVQEDHSLKVLVLVQEDLLHLLVGDEEDPCLGVFENDLNIVRRETGEDGNDDGPHGHDGQVGDSPLGRVLP